MVLPILSVTGRFSDRSVCGGSDRVELIVAALPSCLDLLVLFVAAEVKRVVNRSINDKLLDRGGMELFSVVLLGFAIFLELECFAEEEAFDATVSVFCRVRLCFLGAAVIVEELGHVVGGFCNCKFIHKSFPISSGLNR